MSLVYKVFAHFESKIHKDFELYQAFMCYCYNISQYIHYSQKESTHFRLGVLAHFSSKKLNKKNS